MESLNFSIKVRILGGLTPSQEKVFEQAAARWSEVIVSDLPDAMVNGEQIEDLLITAQGLNIDGEGSILGQARPIFLRPGSLLPVTGIMEFDTSDLGRMEAEGTLQNVILHEMGHVIGIGTLWSRMRLIRNTGRANPVFIGENAMREFGSLIGSDTLTPVPVENEGGPGTREGHWREGIFGNELMTGFLDGTSQPFSRMTIASLQDMGYEVNYSAADDYSLPSALQLALMGINAEGPHVLRCTACARRVRQTEPIVLPEDAMVSKVEES